MIETLKNCPPGGEIDLGNAIIEPFHLRNLEFDQAVTLRGGRFRCPSDMARCFRLDKCRGIHFEGGIVEGTDRSAGAILVDQGGDIAFRNMTFGGLKHGVAHRGLDGFEVSDCTFSDMRIDAIRGGGSSRVLVARNHATDFFPVDTGGAGDHPDFIQFWPLDGYSDNDELTVVDNVFIRGNGSPVQGIFIRGDYENRPRFKQVTVTGNRIDGGLRNGISVSGAAGGEITKNIVLSREPYPLSALRVHDYGGDVCDNEAMHFVGEVPVASNTILKMPVEKPQQTAAEKIEITLKAGQTLIITAN